MSNWLNKWMNEYIINNWNNLIIYDNNLIESIINGKDIKYYKKKKDFYIIKIIIIIIIIIVIIILIIIKVFNYNNYCLIKFSLIFLVDYNLYKINK